MTENSDEIELPGVTISITDLDEVPDVDDVEGFVGAKGEMYVVSQDSLLKFGLTPNQLSDLQTARVLRSHSFVTCGDYNL
ncbi:MAG: hypothetical protein MUF83_15730 [Acidimicrobiales bacterium]|nr:hypothetical protein [Acidimicrobiales bacterium]